MQAAVSLVWQCGERTWRFDSGPLIMGILNVTPDSFSDGGRYLDTRAAVARGSQLAGDGADIVDVGGESTRPGATPVSIETERERVIPVIRALRAETDVAISVDTRHAAIAEEALDAGACIINDVSALTHDGRMPAVARRHRAGVVLMHMRGSPATMQAQAQYEDVVAEVGGYLQTRVAALTAAGLDANTLAVDPGLGFGKTAEHNIALLQGLRKLGQLDRPVVIGLSRKSFLGRITGREVGERLAASLAALAFCVWNGAHVMRVHDVAESVDAIRILRALAAGGRLA